MDRWRQSRCIGVGLPTIAVSMAAVCLAMLAVLSLGAASRERELAEEYAEAVEDYWQTDARCTQLVNSFGALWERDAPFSDYESLARENGAQVLDNENIVFIYFSEQIDEDNAIVVTLSAGERFEITQWQQIYTGAGEADT